MKGKVSVAGVDQESLAYAGSNALALPQQKLKFKKAEATIVGKILSKKQRKRLEKIVDVKKKKEERSSLLEALQAVQVSSLAGLESLSSVQVSSSGAQPTLVFILGQGPYLTCFAFMSKCVGDPDLFISRHSRPPTPPLISTSCSFDVLFRLRESRDNWLKAKK